MTTLILRALASYLAPLVKGRGGVFDLCATPEDTLAMLAQSPASWRCILQFGGAQRIGGSEALRGSFVVVVQQHRGLGVETHGDVAGDRAGDASLLERMEEVCRWMMGAKLSHAAVDCKSLAFPENLQLLSVEGVQTRQMSAEFYASYGLAIAASKTVVAVGC